MTRSYYFLIIRHTEQLVNTGTCPPLFSWSYFGRFTYSVVGLDPAIQAGASHLTIHGRTRHEPSTVPPSLPGIAFAVSLAHAQGVPTIGNGDIWTRDDAVLMRKETGVKGVMAARGLLANPALFSGFEKTPKQAIEVRFVLPCAGLVRLLTSPTRSPWQSFVKISDDYSLPFGLLFVFPLSSLRGRLACDSPFHYFISFVATSTSR